jgi:hypothetical protein
MNKNMTFTIEEIRNYLLKQIKNGKSLGEVYLEISDFAICEANQHLHGDKVPDRIGTGIEMIDEQLEKGVDLEEFVKITGFNTPVEMSAYEKGRQHEEQAMMDWIEKWEGSVNSGLGELLRKKVEQLNKMRTDF